MITINGAYCAIAGKEHWIVLQDANNIIRIEFNTKEEFKLFRAKIHDALEESAEIITHQWALNELKKEAEEEKKRRKA